MFELTTLLTIIFIILLSNRIYFLIFKEKVVFFKYFKFLTLCLIIVLTTTIIFLKLNDTNRVNQDFFQSSVIVYVPAVFALSVADIIKSIAGCRKVSCISPKVIA